MRQSDPISEHGYVGGIVGSGGALPTFPTDSVGPKAERTFGDNFFWVLGGIPEPGSARPFEYYIISDKFMAENVTQAQQQWLATVGAKGQARNDTSVPTVHLPPFRSLNGWDISDFRDRWELIETKLSAS